MMHIHPAIGLFGISFTEAAQGGGGVVVVWVVEKVVLVVAVVVRAARVTRARALAAGASGR